MSLRWPVKDPDEQLDYSVDWSRFLGSETIDTVTWFVKTDLVAKTQIDAGETVDGITNESQTLSSDSKTAIITLSAGTLNKEYVFTCQIQHANTGNISERSIKINIRQK